ncbi:hypothetical protein ACJX0J_031282, partial [Zea mays]
CLVPKFLFLLGAICELGSTIGAVEEVDINSLNSKEIVSGDEDSGKDVKGKSPLKLSSSHANVTLILDEFIKDDEFIPSPAQEKKKLHLSTAEEPSKIAGAKKGGPMEGEQTGIF